MSAPYTGPSPFSGVQQSSDGIHWEPAEPMGHSRKFNFEMWCRRHRLTAPLGRLLGWYDELWLRG